ncbi:MAG: hypothetical protein ABI295_03400, partial [Xanthomarina sp.]
SSKTAIWLRTLSLLPMLALLIYSFSTKKVVQKEAETISKITNTTQEPMATINGISCEDCTVKLSKKAIENLILGTTTNEVVSKFKIKFVGKPTVSAVGNKLNKEALNNLKEVILNDMIQIFDIKTTNSSIKSSVSIQVIDENYPSSSKVKKENANSFPEPPAPPPTPPTTSNSKTLLNPPPPPKSAYDYVKSLKHNDISYSYNGKNVSYDEILKITKKEPRLNMTTNIKNQAGTVHFTSIKK